LSTVVPAEDTIRESAAGGDSDRSQGGTPGDIANGEDVRNVGALPGIRRNEARGVGQDARVVKVQVSRCRLSPNSPDDRVVRPEQTTILSGKVAGAVHLTHQRSRYHSADDADSS